MGIQFRADTSATPVLNQQIRCHCGAVHATVFDTFDEAAQALAAGRFGRGVAMDECAGSDDRDWCENQLPYIHPNTGEESPELDVSGNNGSRILSLLGVPFDYSGLIDATELGGRIQKAINCGSGQADVPGSYFSRVLSQLAEVAEWAKERQLAVAWS